MSARRLASAIALAAALTATSGAARGATVSVVVPDPDSLQYTSFWVALGGGYFQKHGIDVTLQVPATPKEAPGWIKEGKGEAFVLPPPIALELAAGDVPFVIVANLLRNDPIDLVVRGNVARERGLSRELPLKERLTKLKGLKVGVAPGPPPRLEALFRSVGLEAKEVVELVLLPGKLQNAAFADGRVDALYAHTPYLERSLLEQGAEMLVDQAGGEVPALARLQIHTLGVTRELRDKAPEVVSGLVEAVAEAQAALRDAQSDRGFEALHRLFPELRADLGHKLLELYRPAIPETPGVTPEGLAATLPLFPATRVAPPLDATKLRAFVDGSFAEKLGSPSLARATEADASAGERRTGGPFAPDPRVWAAIVGVILAVALAISARWKT